MLCLAGAPPWGSTPCMKRGGGGVSFPRDVRVGGLAIVFGDGDVPRFHVDARAQFELALLVPGRGGDESPVEGEDCGVVIEGGRCCVQGGAVPSISRGAIGRRHGAEGADLSALGRHGQCGRGAHGNESAVDEWADQSGFRNEVRDLWFTCMLVMVAYGTLCGVAEVVGGCGEVHGAVDANSPSADVAKGRNRLRANGSKGPRIALHKAVGTQAARWALAGYLVGGRRYRRRRISGKYRAYRLGSSDTWDDAWRPWTCERDAWAAERRIAARANEAGGGRAPPRCGRLPVGQPPGQEERCAAGATEVLLRPRARTWGCKRRTAVAVAAAVTMMGCRIGEAATPGPPEVDRGLPIVARVVEADTCAIVDYPKPHRDGFRDIASPGFDQGRGGGRTGASDDEEAFALVVEPLNSTGWGPLRRRLLDTKAHILIAQETWVLPAQLSSASDWAVRHGWESVWAPASLGPGGGARGGVAVFARVGMGLRLPSAGFHILEEARAVACFVEPPGHRDIFVASAYMKDGCGTQDENDAIMAKIGRAAEAQGPGCISLIGGDFQCGPAAVDASGYPDMVRGRVIAARPSRGTYRTRAVASELDFSLRRAAWRTSSTAWTRWNAQASKGMSLSKSLFGQGLSPSKPLQSEISLICQWNR